MSTKTIKRTGLLLGLCGLIVAGIVAASSFAATGHRHVDDHKRGLNARSGWPGLGLGLGGLVHSEQVVLDEAGDAYITRTLDSGTVNSSSAGELTIEEGTASVPYKTVTLKIPAGATVTRDGSEATPGEFEDGDFVIVSRSSDGTYVCGGDGEGPEWLCSGDRGAGDGDWGPGNGNWGPGGGDLQGGGPWGRGHGPWGFFGGQ